MRFVVGLLSGLLVVWMGSGAAFGQHVPAHSPPPPSVHHSGGAAPAHVGGAHSGGHAMPAAVISPGGVIPHSIIPPAGGGPPLLGGLPTLAAGTQGTPLSPGTSGSGTSMSHAPVEFVSHSPSLLVPRGHHGAVVFGPKGGITAGPLRPGHYTASVSASTLHAVGSTVRGTKQNYFTAAWYRNHRTIWLPPVFVGAGGLWDSPTWGNVAPFVGITGQPIPYDYGTTALLEDDAVILNGNVIGTPAVYAVQAFTLSTAGVEATPSESSKWQPIGVFGLLQGKETTALRMVQIFVNEDGIVRGNYYDAVADNLLPIYGSIDKKTQRVVWTIGDKKDIVFEAGLSNLLNSETTVLIHYGKDRTDQMILVRLAEPEDNNPKR